MAPSSSRLRGSATRRPSRHDSGACVADERGSTLLLGIGLAVVCLLTVAVVTDTTAAFLQRRSLMAVADSAALAGAQAMDLDAYYRQGARAGTSLDAARVVSAVQRHLGRFAVSEPDLAVVGIRTDGENVWVRLARPLSLPFLGSVLGEGRADEVRVEAVARLDYRPGG